MADSQVDIKDAADVPIPVDTRTQADGHHRQVLVVGDATLPPPRRSTLAGMQPPA